LQKKQKTGIQESTYLMSALGTLAEQKWLEARRRREEGAAAAAAAASAVALFAGYSSDCDEVSSHAALGAMAGYGSDDEEGGGEGRRYDKKIAAEGHSCQRLDQEASGEKEDIDAGAESQDRSQRGPFWLVAGRIDKRGVSEKSEAPHAKRPKVLPASIDALTAAVPAVEDLLALQPKEPSKEVLKAELNAEQARRIEELFFWLQPAPTPLHVPARLGSCTYLHLQMPPKCVFT
jgi:hypothetical protein